MYGYWGKYHSFSDDDDEVQISRMVWIGPLTIDEMKEHFPEYRHNFDEVGPAIVAVYEFSDEGMRRGVYNGETIKWDDEAEL